MSSQTKSLELKSPCGDRCYAVTEDGLRTIVDFICADDSFPGRSQLSEWFDEALADRERSDVRQELCRQLRLQLGDVDVDTDVGANTDADESKMVRVLRRLIRLEQLEHRFDETLQSEKLASLKQLAYGASHEVNNPLGNIATRAQTLMRAETDSTRRQQLAMIVAQAFRAHDMIGDMMLYANPPTPVIQRVDLGESIEQAVAHLRPFAEQQQTAVSIRCNTSDTTVNADPDHMVAMIRAVVQNSLDAVGEGGSVFVECCKVEQTDFAEGDRLRLRIVDDGPGLSELAARHLFDPFFSGREAGRGLGFGLCKAKTIVELHRGEIRVEPGRDAGLCIEILLPMGD